MSTALSSLLRPRLQQIVKAVATKYKRRWKGSDGKWRYEYDRPKKGRRNRHADDHTISHERMLGDIDKHYHAGAAFAAGPGLGHYQIESRDGKNVTFSLDEGTDQHGNKAGEKKTVSIAQFRNMLRANHKDAFARHAMEGLEKRQALLESAKKVGSQPHIERAQKEVARWQEAHKEYLPFRQAQRKLFGAMKQAGVTKDQVRDMLGVGSISEGKGEVTVAQLSELANTLQSASPDQIKDMIEQGKKQKESAEEEASVLREADRIEREEMGDDAAVGAEDEPKRQGDEITDDEQRQREEAARESARKRKKAGGDEIKTPAQRRKETQTQVRDLKKRAAADAKRLRAGEISPEEAEVAVREIEALAENADHLTNAQQGKIRSDAQRLRDNFEHEKEQHKERQLKAEAEDWKNQAMFRLDDLHAAYQGATGQDKVEIGEALLDHVTKLRSAALGGMDEGEQEKFRRQAISRRDEKKIEKVRNVNGKRGGLEQEIQAEKDKIARQKRKKGERRKEERRQRATRQLRRRIDEAQDSAKSATPDDLTRNTADRQAAEGQAIELMAQLALDKSHGERVGDFARSRFFELDFHPDTLREAAEQMEAGHERFGDLHKSEYADRVIRGLRQAAATQDERLDQITRERIDKEHSDLSDQSMRLEGELGELEIAFQGSSDPQQRERILQRHAEVRDKMEDLKQRRDEMYDLIGRGWREVRDRKEGPDRSGDGPVPVANESGDDGGAYGWLGVPKNASQEQIKAAYRQAMRDSHPDRNPNDPQAEERAKRASRAWDVLGNEKRRKAYDRHGNFDKAEKVKVSKAILVRRAVERAMWRHVAYLDNLAS